MFDLMPHIGMEFRHSHEAWIFWLNYGAQKGFEARKKYANKKVSDDKITSCRFVCANEGHRIARQNRLFDKVPSS
jgi:hypothetical protein